MKHKYKVTDATKDELIQYFFGIEGFGGGYLIPADKDRFLIWLERKRTDTLIKANETAIEASQKALEEYIKYVKKANDANNVDEKLKWFEKANRAYERYENYEKQYNLTSKKIDKALGLGKYRKAGDV